MRATAYTTVRPRYGIADVVGLLFRELLLMIVIFLVIFAIGTAAVLTLKRSYTATSTVYAGVGQEYVYQPRVGAIPTDRSGQPLEADAVAQAEAAIMESLEVKRRTVAALGADRILGPKAKGTSAEREVAALKRELQACTDADAQRALRQRISDKQQAIALRLERLRTMRRL